jgi:hypothetical protein
MLGEGTQVHNHQEDGGSGDGDCCYDSESPLPGSSSTVNTRRAYRTTELKGTRPQTWLSVDADGYV